MLKNDIILYQPITLSHGSREDQLRKLLFRQGFCAHSGVHSFRSMSAHVVSFPVSPLSEPDETAPPRRKRQRLTHLTDDEKQLRR